jgi:replicative DNA helicase
MKFKNLEVKAFPCNKNKKPATDNGFKDGTYEFQPIDGDVYGIVCGEVKDENGNKKYLLVIDVDVSKGGLQNWELLSLRFSDEDLDTFTVRTPSGGIHYYFLTDLPYTFKSHLKNGIDLKYVGGYALGANSISDAGTYQIIHDVDIKQLPESIFLYSVAQFNKATNNEDVTFEAIELDIDKKEQVIAGLINNREWDTSYADRLSILMAMKKTGFDISDFTDAVIVGSPTGKEKKDWRTSWNSTTGEATANDYKTLIKYSKVYIDCFDTNESETDTSNELLYLATLVQNKKILKQFVNKPKTLIYQFFSNRIYKEIASFTINYYQENKIVISLNEMKYEFVKKNEDKEHFQILEYVRNIEKAFSFDLSNYDVEKVLSDMVERLNYIYRNSKTMELEKNKELTNEQKLKELANIRPFTITEKKLGLVLGDFATLKAIMENKINKIVSSGYADYDSVFDGGFKAKEMTIFGGISGIGKTMVLGNFAVNSLLDNKNVVYFTFEVAQDIIASRLISNIVNMPSKQLIMNFDKVQNTYETLLANNLSRLRIVEGNSREFSPFDIRTTLDDLKEEGFEADIIFVDYIGIMASDVVKANQDNTNQFQKAIAEDLRNIAKDYNIPVVTAVQLNREAMAKEGGSVAESDMRTFADSIGVAHTADNIIILNQSKEQKAKNLMNFKVSKNRNGINDVNFLANINYDCVKINTLKRVK